MTTANDTTMKLGPMSPETRAMLEENVRIGRAAEKALEAEKARALAEDPRVGQEFYIKFICREIMPGGGARIEGPDGDIYELPVGHLLATPALEWEPFSQREAAPSIREICAKALGEEPVERSQYKLAAVVADTIRILQERAAKVSATAPADSNNIPRSMGGDGAAVAPVETRRVNPSSIHDRIMREFPTGRIYEEQFKQLASASKMALETLGAGGPEFQNMSCLGAIAEVCARYHANMPPPGKLSPAMGANDAVMYLIKEADLDRENLRHYKRDFNGKAYKVTIERVGK